MNLKKTNFLIFISVFPAFVTRSNLSISEIIFTTFVFLIPLILINYFISIKKNFNNPLYKIYISIIIAVSIDNNLGLWNGLIQPFAYKLLAVFDIIYYPGFFLLIILTSLLFLIISLSDRKIINVIINTTHNHH